MNKHEIEALLTQLDAAATLEGDTLAAAAALMRDIFPEAPQHPEVLSEPVEAVLHLIDHCLPGWSIHLAGKAHEPDGHWRCSLRQSRDRDEDEVIGMGTGPTVSLALIKALLRVALAKG